MKTKEDIAREAAKELEAEFQPSWHSLELHARAVILSALTEHEQQQVQEIERLREDKAALDWLEKTKTSIGYNVENGQWGVDFEAPYGKTIREAIHNARKAE